MEDIESRVRRSLPLRWGRSLSPVTTNCRLTQRRFYPAGKLKKIPYNETKRLSSHRNCFSIRVKPDEEMRILKHLEKTSIVNPWVKPNEAFGEREDFFLFLINLWQSDKEAFFNLINLNGGQLKFQDFIHLIEFYIELPLCINCILYLICFTQGFIYY